MPVFVIATKGPSYEKVVSNIQEVKARKGKIIAVVTEGDEQVKEFADDYIEIPKPMNICSLNRNSTFSDTILLYCGYA